MSGGEGHDPGGKVRIALRAGIVGGAAFSDCGRHRTMLTRTWDPAGSLALWIGMNPSTADGLVDDPTVRREVDFSMRWGHGRYAKANVMDFRATKPKALLAEGVVPSSPANLPAIVAAAREADVVVLAFGSLHRRLRVHGEAVVAAIEGIGKVPMCVGTTADGSPRHPLYVKGDTPLVAWVRPGVALAA